MSYNIILDPGHGGIDEQGNYVTAPSKMHRFHDGFTVYEGERNRVIAEKVKKCFMAETEPEHRIHYTVHPDDASDISLEDRVDFANSFNPKNTLFISLHNNAGGGNGFEIYTSKGETSSDKLATSIYNFSENTYKNYGLPMRHDWTDDDPDKEANFYVLRKTICPAVLIESAFFDNIVDAELLFNDTFLDEISFSIYVGIVDFINKKTLG